MPTLSVLTGQFVVLVLAVTIALIVSRKRSLKQGLLSGIYSEDAKRIAALFAQVGDILDLHRRGLLKLVDLSDAKFRLKPSPNLLSFRNCNEETRQLLRQRSTELSKLTENCVGQWRNERRRFDEYAAKTEELDRTADLLKTNPDGSCQVLIRMIHAMREENESLRRKVIDCQSQMAALMTRLAHTTREARTDTVTKLPNRRAWDEKMEELRCDGSLYLAIVDLDQFKSVNDNYGHPAGDALLNLLGTLLRDSPSVSAFRTGGDEFGLILERRNDKAAYDAVDSIRSRIRQAKLSFKGRELRTTVSIGMTRGSMFDSGHTAVARADKAMYLAKTAGGNRIQFCDTHASVTEDLLATAESDPAYATSNRYIAADAAYSYGVVSSKR